jgi:hypothetical protein
MKIELSGNIQQDVDRVVRTSLSQSLVLNVLTAAEQIRRRHEELNVALEDIAQMVARTAVQCGCAVEFGDRRASLAEEHRLSVS